MVFLYGLIFIFSCFILIRSGASVVRSLTRIAQFLGWREFVVASVLMAFATSLPEVFIGLTSALHGKPQLSFGNVIGSNIIVLTLVIGIGAILAKGIKFEGKTLQRSSLYAILIGFFPLVLLLDGEISRVEGVILLLALVIYFYRLCVQEERFTKVFSNHFKRNWTRFRLFLKDLAIFGFGVVLLILSSEGIVYSAEKLAIELNLSLVVIGLFLVAIGTSMPEITFGIRSVIMGHQHMLLGDVIGSVVINSTFVLGTTVIISPLRVENFSPYIVGIIFTLLASFVFLIFLRTGKEISKKEAIFLIELYLLFFLAEMLVN